MSVQSDRAQQARETGSSRRAVVCSSLMGSIIEWYDFYLFGTAASFVFGQLFFPSSNPLGGTLLAFATYGAGFFMRPVGGVVFGHFGDKVSRKTMLIVTLFLMGVATFLIGVLPTFQNVGLIAPILLVVFRLIQGFAAGGEWGGALIMTVEHAPNNRRGLYGSMPNLGIPLGTMLASLALLVVTSALSNDAFFSWGWRIPFLFSAILIGVGAFVRLRVAESSAMLKVKDEGIVVKVPLFELLRRFWPKVILALGGYLILGVMFTIAASFSITYATQTARADSDEILLVVLLSTGAMAVVMPISAAISDIIGRKPLYLAGVIGMGVWSFAIFPLLDTSRFPMMLLGVGIAFIFVGVSFGPLGAMYAEMFPTEVRYTGTSVAYQVGNVLGPGIAPFIATALLIGVGDSWIVSIYITLVALISLVCMLAIRLRMSADLKDVVE